MEIKVGTKFIRRGTKRKDIETVIDIHTTTNLKGEVVKVSYVSTHIFMGQVITNYDIIGTTILRGLV
jgi:hypothetical protein